MSQPLRLRTLGLGLLLVAFVCGGVAAWLWVASDRNWQLHLTRAYVTGFSLFETLVYDQPAPQSVIVTPMSAEQSALADAGSFTRLPRLPTPGYLTNMSLQLGHPDPLSGAGLSLAIVSDTLRYPVSELVSDEAQKPAQKLGEVTRLLATYCGDPVLFARLGDGRWQRIDGQAVWGCDAAPRDLRLLAVLLGVLSLAVLGTLMADSAAHFERFARALRGRDRLGGPDSYPAQGPAELREIVASVNDYLERERDQLSKRAIVLSGVSHDLGTPATRLRLRTALISDPDLRAKFETDIDAMTGMIESVLTYTRSELNSEDPRSLSLASLVEALVDDYADLGQPVSYRRHGPLRTATGPSIFSTKPGHGSLSDAQRILVTARPVSLQRALSNLVDNALKYGRRATVELRANADHAIITVEDDGSGISVEEIEDMIAPFKRGPGKDQINGFGLGLTIAATVAEQHGGRLYFERGGKGLRANLEIRRR
ncbi:HAMP domain-containing sensor histidine kinase [Mesobacterium sp. TK19101]|uniref:histidine kinase n=1 Tax=Mesobacterium hydrothermale TaxID=3111907 RepID=A0ABU6HKP0_9RHOB|nr:HAMP domain-containing sensor histidine kinase [Mesobacterium sp. TK19101]MEC3862446.1 HAMP domain-containing sensor histidine kinase [Mesobacterium sp. TK19101]